MPAGVPGPLCCPASRPWRWWRWLPVCVPGSQPAAPAAVPATAAEALAGLAASLGYLAAADVAEWPEAALAGCLRALGRAESVQLAARSRVLSAFNACGGVA